MNRFCSFLFSRKIRSCAFFCSSDNIQKRAFPCLEVYWNCMKFFRSAMSMKRERKTMSVESQHHGMNPVTPTFYENGKNHDMKCEYDFKKVIQWKRYRECFFCARSCKSLGLDFGFIFFCTLYFHREILTIFSSIFSLTREFKLCVFNVHAVYLARCDTYCRVCHKKILWNLTVNRKKPLSF